MVFSGLRQACSALTHAEFLSQLSLCIAATIEMTFGL